MLRDAASTISMLRYAARRGLNMLKDAARGDLHALESKPAHVCDTVPIKGWGLVGFTQVWDAFGGQRRHWWSGAGAPAGGHCGWEACSSLLDSSRCSRGGWVVRAGLALLKAMDMEGVELQQLLLLQAYVLVQTTTCWIHRGHQGQCHLRRWWPNGPVLQGMSTVNVQFG